MTKSLSLGGSVQGKYLDKTISKPKTLFSTSVNLHFSFSCKTNPLSIHRSYTTKIFAVYYFNRAQKGSNQGKEKEIPCLKKNDHFKHDLHDTSRKLSKDQRHLSMHICRGIVSDDSKKSASQRILQESFHFVVVYFGKSEKMQMVKKEDLQDSNSKAPKSQKSSIMANEHKD